MGESQRVVKNNRKNKKESKNKKIRCRARSAGLTPFLGVPESRVSRPGRQTVDGFGAKTFKFQKKRSETKKNKKKSFRPKTVGWATQTGRFGIAKKTSKIKDYSTKRRSRLDLVKRGGGTKLLHRDFSQGMNKGEAWFPSGKLVDYLWLTNWYFWWL